MILFSILFSVLYAHSLSALDFMESQNTAFNRAFLEKQIQWCTQNYLPDLQENPEFQQELKNFILSNQDFLFLKNQKPHLLTYFVRQQHNFKNQSPSFFELGLLNKNGHGSLWTEKGKVPFVVLSIKKDHLPDFCHLKKDATGFISAEFNTQKKTCKVSYLDRFGGHPMYLGRIIEVNSSKTERSFLLPKEVYPGIIQTGVPSLYFRLKEEWRLGISRVYNGKDESIYYFP